MSADDRGQRTDTWAAVTAAMSVRMAAHWTLYADWQASHGRAPGPADMEQMRAFADECPASVAVLAERVRAVRIGHEAAGSEWFASMGGRSTVPAPTGWLPARDALVILPTRRFPAGFRGRRDGFLVVLAAELGMTRSEMLALRHDDVLPGPGFTIAGLPVSYDDDTRRCPRCAVTRWLRALGEVSTGGRGAGYALLDPTLPDTGHDCTHDLDLTWTRTPTLLPQIDQHGWIGGPLSRRSLTAILSRRLRDRGAPTGGQPDTWTERVYQGRFKDATSTELATAQDDVDAQLAALLARSGELIDQAKRDLDLIGG